LNILDPKLFVKPPQRKKLFKPDLKKTSMLSSSPSPSTVLVDSYCFVKLDLNVRPLSARLRNTPNEL